MGVSHAGVAYVKDGAVYHLDNPMDAEHLGPKLKGDFTGGAGGVSGAVMSRSNKDQTVILWFEVADLDASMDAILAAGGSVAGDRNEIPGEGQVQYAADPEGNIIGLKQPRRQA
jgi:predicted enzyme related to lactoylglutathione lyase